MSMYYNPKVGWVTVPEQTVRPVQTTHHRIVSENSVQSLEALVHQLLESKTTDPNTILSTVQAAIKKHQADTWHRENGGGGNPQPGIQPGAQPGVAGGMI